MKMKILAPIFAMAMVGGCNSPESNTVQSENISENSEAIAPAISQVPANNGRIQFNKRCFITTQIMMQMSPDATLRVRNLLPSSNYYRSEIDNMSEETKADMPELTQAYLNNLESASVDAAGCILNYESGVRNQGYPDFGIK